MHCTSTFPSLFCPRKHNSEASFEALSWTEYCRALSELCPVFRRSFINIPPTISRKPFTPSNNAERPATSHYPMEDDHRVQNTREAFSIRGKYSTIPCNQVRRVWEVSENCPGRSSNDIRNQFPPRIPGANSYGVLRRKRQAAISVDYESITMEAPQVTD